MNELGNNEAFASQTLGQLWQGLNTEWSDVRGLLAWSQTALQMPGREKLLRLAAQQADLSSLVVLAEFIETVATKLLDVLKHLQIRIRPEAGRFFGAGELAGAPIEKLLGLISEWLASLDGVNDWVAAREALTELRRIGLHEIAGGLEGRDIPSGAAGPMLDLGIAEVLWKRASAEAPELNHLDGAARSRHVEEFKRLDRERIGLARHEVLTRYLDRKPNGASGEMGIVRSEIDKKRGHRALRRLMEDAGSAVQRLKPVFMMSPLSIAQFLPPGKMTFDLLVIDEASQVAPEDALGAIARARQIVVVGDHKQLPPTNFFKLVNAGDDVSEEDGEEAENFSRPSDFESILTLSRTRGIAERMLSWHYRSKHPSLIALSNDECYGGRLLLPPSPFQTTSTQGLSLIATERGHYGRGDTRCDVVQAAAVARAVASHMRTSPNLSLGVVCLSVQQRDTVEDMLDQIGVRSEADAFSPKPDERLLVKSLEEIQGDERDVIFISIGYGVDRDGRMTQNFGPISRDGGDRRLNVLISRARHRCVVFSSLTAADISAESEVRGTRMLRSFLHFAETGKMSVGEPISEGDFDSPFEEAVAQVIRDAGYRFHSQVGVSGFRIDLGVINPDRPGRFILGVECDGATYHSARSARDRDRLRQEVLEGLGWKLHRIWSTDWFRNPNREADRLVAAIKEADTFALAQQVEAPTSPVLEASEQQPENFAVARVLDVDAGHAPALVGTVATSRVKPYVECKPLLPRNRDLFALATADVARVVVPIVEVEGPIHTNEVARRVREGFGLGRTGVRILEHVRRGLSVAARDGRLARVEEFWSVADRELDHVRDRRQAALSLRQADQISPQEYRLAAMIALDDAVSLLRDELTVQTARLLGFERTGPDLRVAIDNVVNEMERSGEICPDDQGRLGRTRAF